MRSAHARWQLVIFDNDGVVVDSEPLAAVVISGTLTQLGYPMTPAECDEAFRGITPAATRSFVEGRFGRPLPPDFEDIYLGRLFRTMKRELRPVPGVLSVLDSLDAAGMPYCLASSAERRRVLFALGTTDLAQRFAGRWWGAEDVARGKPAPDLFLLAAKSMGFAPSACVVVEDAKAGVQAARAAGMSVLGYAARAPAGELADATAVFTDMQELPQLLFPHRDDEPSLTYLG